MKREIVVMRNKENHAIELRIGFDGQFMAVSLTEEEAVEVKLALGSVVDDGVYREVVPFQG